jgi:hypothetical protein
MAPGLIRHPGRRASPVAGANPARSKQEKASMTDRRSRKLFVNLAVRDLERSKSS